LSRGKIKEFSKFIKGLDIDPGSGFYNVWVWVARPDKKQSKGKPVRAFLNLSIYGK
jgi:hypothetical protein